MTGTIAAAPDCRQVDMEMSMTMTAREMDEREFGNLIGSDKVEGTAVYGPDDTKIGAIERVMIDKLSGRVSYAVLGFGGILGLGNNHYPLPWQSLKYDTRLGGYRTGVTESQLRSAPNQRWPETLVPIGFGTPPLTAS
jgi:hypothetical protein